jgi:hypothetical protein
MSTYRGTARGNIIMLPDGVELADGQQVEVRILSSLGATDGHGSDELDPEEQFLQDLLEAGVISEIKRPNHNEPLPDDSPSEVRGKPLSEMIIEERR